MLKRSEAASLEGLERIEPLLGQRFKVERFPHSLNVSPAGSDLRVQIQLDPRYHAFVPRSSMRDVLGVQLPVARLEDVLQGKIWAARDPTCHSSKRQKDLADIARLIESHPDLRRQVPVDVLDRLIWAPPAPVSTPNASHALLANPGFGIVE